MVEDLEETKRRLFEEQQKLETQQTIAERARTKIRETISKIPEVTKEILLRGRGIGGREEIRRVEEARLNATSEWVWNEASVVLASGPPLII